MIGGMLLRKTGDGFQSQWLTVWISTVTGQVTEEGLWLRGQSTWKNAVLFDVELSTVHDF